MGHYPSDPVLTYIKEFDVTKNNIEELIEVIQNEWEYSQDGGLKRYINDDKEDILELHTFGWSGNEDLINALKNNWMFWSVCWVQSRRGGHYLFEIKDVKKAIKTKNK